MVNRHNKCQYIDSDTFIRRDVVLSYSFKNYVRQFCINHHQNRMIYTNGRHCIESDC